MGKYQTERTGVKAKIPYLEVFFCQPQYVVLSTASKSIRLGIFLCGGVIPELQQSYILRQGEPFFLSCLIPTNDELKGISQACSKRIPTPPGIATARYSKQQTFGLMLRCATHLSNGEKPGATRNNLGWAEKFITRP
jgi:hypothetical protein